MGKNNMNKELRLKFTPASYAILENRKAEISNQTGDNISWSYAINQCMETLYQLTEEHNGLVQEHEDLMRRYHAATAPPPLVPHVRETVDLFNIKEKKYKQKESSGLQTPEPKKRGKHLLPKEFAPPRSIAKEAGIDYEGAIECFADWANSQGKKYTDWTACFRNACRSWLKEKFPHLRRAPIQPHGNTEILRNEDMSDTRPPLDLGSD
jgi:hypothetical protein